jgi:hypothetical protein
VKTNLTCSDSFDDPLGIMMDQSKWAFRNSILLDNKPEGQRFWEIHLHFEKEILSYLEEVGVHRALPPDSLARTHVTRG